MKVLVVSHNPFSQIYNNGKTLLSLFNEWSKDEIAQLFFYDETPDFSVCTNYYKISDIDILNSIIHFSPHCGSSINHDYINQSKSIISNLINKPKIKEKKMSLALIRDIIWKSKVWKTKDLYKWITDFSPQLIFFVGGGSGFSHEIAYWISVQWDIPLCVFFTDDYVLNLLKKNINDYIQAYRKKQFYKKTINHASKCFVIGDMMADAYTRNYNKPFIAIMNCVSIKPYIQPRRCSDIVFSYFGGLHLHRWKSISKLGILLHMISIDCNMNYIFKVYTASNIDKDIERSFSLSYIQYCGCLEPSKLEKEMQSSDVLVHVESFDTKYRILTKYSVSTKIPEYLAQGRCILVFGPQEIASVKLLSEDSISFVITDSDSDESMMNTLKRIFIDAKMREDIGYNGYLFAQKRFDRKQVRQRLLFELEEICK